MKTRVPVDNDGIYFHWKWKGVQSERTERWETGRVIGAIFLILFGAGMMCWVLSMSSQRAQEEARRDQNEANIRATVTTQASLLDTEFADLIADWQSDDTRGVHTVPRADMDGLATIAYYGRCNSSFYAFIVGYRGDDYAYVPDSTPENCKPSGLQFDFLQRIISFGNDWYRVSIRSGADEIITRTPRPGTPTATATITPNATFAQATINAAIEQQVTAAVATQAAAVTQTIDAAVEMTLAAATTTGSK